jgi:hypothetical protein
MTCPSLSPATPQEQAANLAAYSGSRETIIVGPAQRAGSGWYVLVVLLGKKGMLESHLVGLPVRNETDPRVVYIIPLKRAEELANISDLMFGDAAKNAQGILTFHLGRHFKRVQTPGSNAAFAEAINRFRTMERKKQDVP